MKNIVIIDIDSEREKQIVIGKPDSFPKPTTTEEMSKMVVDDISSLSQALVSLIKTAHLNKIGTKNQFIDVIKNQLDILGQEDI